LQSETETRPRHLILSPRRDRGRDRDLPIFSRDRDETQAFDFGSETETESFKTETETFFETLYLQIHRMYVSRYHDDDRFNLSKHLSYQELTEIFNNKIAQMSVLHCCRAETVSKSYRYGIAVCGNCLISKTQARVHFGVN